MDRTKYVSVIAAAVLRETVPHIIRESDDGFPLRSQARRRDNAWRRPSRAPGSPCHCTLFRKDHPAGHQACW